MHLIPLYFVIMQHARNEINLQLMTEAEYYGDVVIVPFMDNYDLVVLKTAAICDYAVILKRISGHKLDNFYRPRNLKFKSPYDLIGCSNFKIIFHLGIGEEIISEICNEVR